MALAEAGQLEEAAAAFRAALVVRRSAQGHEMLAQVGARECTRGAAACLPQQSAAQQELRLGDMQVLMELGEDHEAVAAASVAARLDPEVWAAGGQGGPKGA